jgi:nucleoside-diphosphate-sugar epimerase
MDRGAPIVILRLTGIYGPGRTRSVEAFRKDRIWYHPDRSFYLNKIHVEDIARAVVRLDRKQPVGEVFNLSDPNPPERKQFYRWLSERMNRPVPDPSGDVPRSGNKRVSSLKLRRQTGFSFRYPSFREGLAPLLQDGSP